MLPVMQEKITAKMMAELAAKIFKEALPKENATAKFSQGVRFAWMLSSDYEHAPIFLAEMPPPPRMLYRNFWGPGGTASGRDCCRLSTRPRCRAQRRTAAAVRSRKTLVWGLKTLIETQRAVGAS